MATGGEAPVAAHGHPGALLSLFWRHSATLKANGGDTGFR